MKLVRMVLVAAVVFLFAGVSFAQTPIDPGIGLGGTGSTGSFTQTQCFLSLTDPSCTLMLTNGNGIADITNDTGFNIISDTVTVDGTFLNGIPTPFAGMLVCNSENPFGLTDTTGSTATSCMFSEPSLSDPTGILQVYGINFQNFCADAACTMPLTSLTFDLKWINGTTPIPEPGTMLLLGTGLVGLMARRKWRKGIGSNV